MWCGGKVNKAMYSMSKVERLNEKRERKTEMEEIAVSVGSVGWFGYQGERLRLEQGMMGVQGGLVERRGRGQEGGVQGGEGDWPREERRGRLTTWGADGERDAGVRGGRRGRGGWGRSGSRRRGWGWRWWRRFGDQREVRVMTLGFGSEWQRLGLLRVSGGGRSGRGQGGGGCGRGVQHAAVRGRRAVNHLLLRQVLHTRFLIPRRVICSRGQKYTI